MVHVSFRDTKLLKIGVGRDAVLVHGRCHALRAMREASTIIIIRMREKDFTAVLCSLSKKRTKEEAICPGTLSKRNVILEVSARNASFFFS